MPWYMLVSNGSDRNPDYTDRFTEGFGVKVQPNAFVTWQYDGAGVTMWADVRCGGMGVILGGRTLDVCDIVFDECRIRRTESGMGCELHSGKRLPPARLDGNDLSRVLVD